MSTNPDQSSASTDEPPGIDWRTLVDRANPLLWGGGMVLIALSWTGTVSATVGWIGFGIAAAPWVLSHIRSWAPHEDEKEWVYLTSPMLRSKESDYYVVIDRFIRGHPMFYRQMVFQNFPDHGEVVCSTVASVEIEDMNEQRIQQEIGRARDAVESLKKISPEFAEAVTGRTFRISLMDDYRQDAEEIRRVVDGRIVRSHGRGQRC